MDAELSEKVARGWEQLKVTAQAPAETWIFTFRTSDVTGKYEQRRHPITKGPDLPLK